MPRLLHLALIGVLTPAGIAPAAHGSPTAPPRRVAHGGGAAVPAVSAPDAARTYRLRVVTEPARPAAGREARLTVFLSGPGGEPLRTLEVHHERLAHFLLVSENLADFQHLHPEDFGLLTPQAKREGRFEMPVTFGFGGRYLLAVDFVDQGRAVHREAWLTVEGPAQPPTEWRLSRRRTVEGVGAELFTAPDPPEAGSGAEGTVVLSRDGRPLADLEPHLGALAHLAIYREGATSSAHVHGVGGTSASGREGHGHAGHEPAGAPGPGAAGPRVFFAHTFDEPGRYRVFVQVQRRGTVLTVPFDLEVAASRGAAP